MTLVPNVGTAESVPPEREIIAPFPNVRKVESLVKELAPKPSVSKTVIFPVNVTVLLLLLIKLLRPFVTPDILVAVVPVKTRFDVAPPFSLPV